MPLLAEHFQVFAVDLRGQGRSTRTPGRYTLDNMGNDLVRFIDLVIGRPTIVSGLSSGGVLTAWLSAYAKPGQVFAALYEDPPLFASEVRPAVGPGIRQCIGPMFDLWSTFLGDQWSIGAWDAMREAAATHLPEHLRFVPVPATSRRRTSRSTTRSGAAPFWSGTVGGSCDHERMLRSVKVASVLLTHHMRTVDDTAGFLLGAMSDQQAQRVQDLLTGAGVKVDYRSFPDVGHSMHGERPDLYVETLLDWARSIGVMIDVHAHYVPDSYRAALLANGHGQPDGFPQIPAWSAEEHVAAMDRLGIATSLLSISSPGVHFGDGATAVDLAREVNEAGRRAVVDHPGRFGLLGFASAARRRRRDRRDRVLLRPPRRRRLRGAHQRRRHLPGRPRLRAGVPRARPPRRPAVHPPDVAAVLGAHVVRPSPSDARVLLRHHPRRRRPGAERHHRDAPRDRAHRPARRSDARRWSPTGSPSSPCCSTSIPQSTCSATSAGSTSTSPGSRFPASSTRCSRSRRSTTSTTAATTRSPPSSRPRWPPSDSHEQPTGCSLRSAPTPSGSSRPSAAALTS